MPGAKGAKRRRVRIASDHFGCRTWHHPGDEIRWWLNSRPRVFIAALKMLRQGGSFCQLWIVPAFHSACSFLPDRPAAVAPAFPIRWMETASRLSGRTGMMGMACLSSFDFIKRDAKRVMQSGFRQQTSWTRITKGKLISHATCMEQDRNAQMATPWEFCHEAGLETRCLWRW